MNLTANQSKPDLINEIITTAEGNGKTISVSRAGRLADKIIAGKYDPDMQRVLDYADPTGEQAVARASRNYKTGPQHHRWKGDDIAYKTIHKRVRVANGPACGYLCDCGRQAQQWAYDHQDRQELTDPRTGCVYSPRVDHYKPICRVCHCALDRAYRQISEAA